ncbi:polysaccharide deacetylase family protein [uncultured Winogradskyella sp.]|uniref:polysaccharide deacetylase family protein n=1 Tax=uncultured Winogradskyella sp. TaxID=395353 RepID=UPI0030DD130F|tara:strand:+ start:7089 stop:8003 length:915 start_codon:yes stop_codon:yes gene_type:complete
MHILKITIGKLLIVLGCVRLIKFLGRNKPIFIVLNYHNFSKYNNYGVKRGSILETGYDEQFGHQIQWLSKHFKFLYPEEFFENKPKKGVYVLLTFDDGYKDNYDIAFPILKKYNSKAIFFVVTKLIGTKEWLLHDKLRYLVTVETLTETEIENQLRQLNQGKLIDQKYLSIVDNFDIPNHRLMMNWEELSEIINEGYFVQPHTHNHSMLSISPMEKQFAELNTSIEVLTNKLNHNAKYFAFPNGMFNSTTLQILKKSIINYSFTTISGINTLDEDVFKIKRIGVNASDTLGVILLKLLRKVYSK